MAITASDDFLTSAAVCRTARLTSTQATQYTSRMSLRLRPLAALLLLLPALLLATAPPSAAQQASPMPQIVKRDGRFALMVDGAPYLMLGVQVNNSSAWPAMLPKVWPTVEQLHANTVEAPIYWEQWEPTPGHFDASVLHDLLAQARTHHVHLVLLWFGTWKNGSGHYLPSYLKLDEARVPHVTTKTGGKVDSLSPYSTYVIDEDKKAFSALMHELKLADPQHTVLMVQVENEIGTYGSLRDYTPAANKLFDTAVPANILTAYGKQQPGTWQQVFGADADEFFYAWSIAKDVNAIAAAGKAENPLPMYINVATRNPINGTRGSYPSGGAVDGVLPIWKATAPSIDLIGIDLYDANYAVYTKLLDLYHRPDNAMFVPETGNATAFARFFYAALGHQAIGYSVFGMDKTGYVNFPLGALHVDDETIAPFALNYAIVAPMDREIARLNFEGKVQGVAEEATVHSRQLDFGDWKVYVGFGQPEFGGGQQGAPGNQPADGGALVAQLGPSEFLITGTHCRIDFNPTASGRQRQFVRVEEGTYVNGVWTMTRLWNGDQSDYGLNFTALPQVLRVTLATY